MKQAVIAVVVCLWALSGCAPQEVEGPVEAEAVRQEVLVSALDPWVARHGLTVAQYQSELSHWAGQGYRLTWVSGYEEGGVERYATIWHKTGGPAWLARAGLTSAEYQSEVQNLLAQGYRVVLVNGYSVGGVARYAAIFQADCCVAWVGRHDLTPAQYQAEFNTWWSQGFRLAHVSGYTSAGAERHAAVWVGTQGPAQSAFHALTSAQYQERFVQMSASGYRLAQLSSYNVGGTDLYAGFFEQQWAPAIPMAARHGLTAAQYGQEMQDLRYQGYRPVLVSAHNSGGTTRFALLWHNLSFSANDLWRINDAVDQAMNRRNMAGLSLAVTRNGQLMFAKAYGNADDFTPAHTANRYRVASVSKPLTAIGIMRLVQSGRLDLSRTVFGPNGVLGETYGAQGTYRDPRVLQITVRDLLEHRAGGWDNHVGTDEYGNQDTMPDPMFQNPLMTQAQLITWVLQNLPLDYSPGTYQYSNFGYCVLGRIIERVTGKTYETFMRDELTALSGAPSFAIGGNVKTPRLPNEVVYYDRHAPGGNTPYEMKVSRMDAHGDWVVSPVDLLRVAVRADGFSTVPDLLSSSAISTMTQPLPPPGMVTYARGWSVNSEDTWWHTGYIPGSTALLARLSNRYGPSGTDAFTVAIMTNSSTSFPNQDIDELYGIMWSIVTNVAVWPAHDLF